MKQDQTMAYGSFWKCVTAFFEDKNLDNPFEIGGIYRMGRSGDKYYLEGKGGDNRYPGELFGWPLEKFHEQFKRVL